MELERRTYTKSVKSAGLSGSEPLPRAAYKAAVGAVWTWQSDCGAKREWWVGWGERQRATGPRCIIPLVLCKTQTEVRGVKGRRCALRVCFVFTQRDEVSSALPNCVNTWPLWTHSPGLEAWGEEIPKTSSGLRELTVGIERETEALQHSLNVCNQTGRRAPLDSFH